MLVKITRNRFMGLAPAFWEGDKDLNFKSVHFNWKPSEEEKSIFQEAEKKKLPILVKNIVGIRFIRFPKKNVKVKKGSCEENLPLFAGMATPTDLRHGISTSLWKNRTRILTSHYVELLEDFYFRNLIIRLLLIKITICSQYCETFTGLYLQVCTGRAIFQLTCSQHNCKFNYAYSKKLN